MRTSASHRSRLLSGSLALVLGTLVLAGCGPTETDVAASAQQVAAPAQPSGEDPSQVAPGIEGATVERIVDGDTIDVILAGSLTRVRLLNIDTPESVDPSKPVECLSLEATAFLREILPLGATVHLDYDVERTDRHGRTLARVVHEGRPVSAEIARAGLGTPMTIEPNHRYRPEVDAAFEEARQAQRGLLSADIPCTLPAQVGQLTAMAALTASGQAELSQVEDAAGEIVSAVTAGGIAASVAGASGTLRQDVGAAVRRARAGHAQRAASGRRAAREKAAAQARAQRERAASKARQQAQQMAAERARRAAQAAPAPQPQRMPAPQPRVTSRMPAPQPQPTYRPPAPAPRPTYQAPPPPPAPAPRPPSRPGADPRYDGYTGCRAYGPSGTSVDEKGRRYTKIPC